MQKVLFAVLLGVSTLAVAGENLDSQVDRLLKSVRDIRIAVNKLDNPSKEEIRNAACARMSKVVSAASDLYSAAAASGRSEVDIRRARTASDKVNTANQFCGSQEGVDPNLKIYSYGQMMGILDQATSLIFELRSNELPNEGALNCDSVKDSLRLALNPNTRRLWAVRLNEEGAPETRLPYEFRIAEMQVQKFEVLRCPGCYDVEFKLDPSSPYSTIKAEIRNFKLNLFDISQPEKPEQTWQDVHCK